MLMEKNKKHEMYSPFQFSSKVENTLFEVFWKFLFIPDVIVKSVFYLCANHKEFLASHFITYWLITILAIFSCIYFPIIYVLTWKKANSNKENLSSNVLAKIYIILSASISNSAFIILGGGSYFS